MNEFQATVNQIQKSSESINDIVKSIERTILVREDDVYETPVSGSMGVQQRVAVRGGPMEVLSHIRHVQNFAC